MRSWIVMLLVLPLLLATVSSCTSRLVRVQPYEREYLARDRMLFTPAPAATDFREHVLSIREGSRGGEASFQGGCGCR